MNTGIEQARLIKEMMDHIAFMQKRFQAEGEDEERRWMMANAPDAGTIDFLNEATVLSLHVVDAIGESEPVNGITISKRFGIPRGSVSKITRRLAEQGVVQVESLPDNKKEVLFRLTSTGQQIYKLHKRLHSHIDENVRKFLNRYDLEQLRFLTRCLKESAESSWVRLEQDGSEPDKDNGISILPADVVNSSRETDETSEILTLLNQLDTRQLRKAKELIRIAFIDA